MQDAARLPPLLFADYVVAPIAIDPYAPQAAFGALNDFADLENTPLNFGPLKTAVVAGLEGTPPSDQRMASHPYKPLSVQIDTDLQV